MRIAAFVLLIGSLFSPPAAIGSTDCAESVRALQILGSGGPFGVGRASSGYLIWEGGKSIVMIDAGGGTFARFHEAKARISDLKVFALSHLHPDHSSELPALFWTQPSNLLFAGPSGGELFPPVDTFLEHLFSPESGAFPAIGTYLERRVKVIDANASEPTLVYQDESVKIQGIGVPHADTPTIGYRVDVGNASIGFSSDQIGTNPAFTRLVAGVDVLVIHFAASETPELIKELHAKPSVWGEMASEVAPELLVLSHLSKTEPSDPRYLMHSGSDLTGNIAHLRKRYQGKLLVAEDLHCLPL